MPTVELAQGAIHYADIDIDIDIDTGRNVLPEPGLLVDRTL
jgi:hypothetical protein